MSDIPSTACDSPSVKRALRRLTTELASGRYRTDIPLPTHREWARRLGVSKFTVARAIGELKAAGVVDSQEGSYTFLRQIPAKSPARSVVFSGGKPAVVSFWHAERQDLRKMRLAIVRRRFQERFQRERPDVRIQERFVDCDSSALHALVLRNTLTGSEPTAGHTMQTYLPFLLDHQVAAPFPDEFFDPEGIQAASIRRCSLNGRLCMLPTNISASFLLYNREAFDKAGLNPRRPPRNWEEFAVVCRKLAQAGHRNPAFCLPSPNAAVWWLMQSAYQCLSPWNGDTLPPLDWSSPAALRALKWCARLWFQFRLARVHPGDSYGLTSECLLGAIPMVVDDGALASQIAQLGQADRFGIAPMPAGPNGQIISLRNCSGWFLNAHAAGEQQAAAASYLYAWEQWLHEGDGGSQMKRLGVWPALIPLLGRGRRDHFAADGLPRDWLAVLEELDAHSFWEPANADWQKVVLGDVLRDLIGRNEFLSAEQIQWRLRLVQHECGLQDAPTAIVSPGNLRRNSGSRRGFTLIEILVVIAIIAILAALLMPALNKARDSARAAGCVSNLRQVMQTVHMYVNDHEEMFPWVPGSNNTPAQALGLAGYFDKGAGILQCPGFKNWSRYGLTQPETPMRPPITALNGGDDNSIQNTYRWRRFSALDEAPQLRFTTIPNPGAEWYVCDFSMGSLQYPPKLATPSHGSAGGVVGYADGHAQWLSSARWSNVFEWGARPETPGDFSFY
ncbi:MAG: extracellular solute-binding protein [Verrucomicrobia bacterium]|nr:extracellular solute-binding protein [Verrucomicrobiota bacterium]